MRYKYMNELCNYVNKEFGCVRGCNINGEAYLVGKDVSELLGYEKWKQRHCASC